MTRLPTLSSYDVHKNMVVESGKLYIVATPIGNLEDMTLRAIRILNEVDMVLSEDTRVGGKLLKHYQIATPLKSYHAHTEGKHESIGDMIAQGKNLAVITDAGTPGISDPGETLVAYVRERFGVHSVVAVPGPSALAAAISISGIPVHEFTFIGFLPHKKGRQTALQEVCSSERTMIFYESTHRIMKAMEYLAEHLPADRTVIIAREITKMFEETIAGSAQEVFAELSRDAHRQRGEFVVLVKGKSW